MKTTFLLLKKIIETTARGHPTKIKNKYPNMKNKYHNLSRELITAKRPNQMLISAAITAIVFTATPSFAEQVPSVLPANVIDVSELNYTSPRTKAAQLKEEFIIPAQSPVRDARSTSMRAGNPRCILGNVDFKVEDFCPGAVFKPGTWITITLGNTTGNIRVYGQYCFDGAWNAGGTGRLKAANTILLGLSSGGYRTLVLGGKTYRWKVEAGIEAYGDLSGNGGFEVAYANQHWEKAGITLAGAGEFGVRSVLPTVTLQYRAGSVAQPNWTTVRHFANPTNGEPVQGWEFEAAVYGQFRVEADMNFGYNDYDFVSVGQSATGRRDRHIWSMSGEAGVKFKIKYDSVTFVNYDLRYVNRIIPQTDKTTPITRRVDEELDRRPTK